MSDSRVLGLLRERGVRLEVCPTSYPPLGVHELAAVPALLDAGVAVALAGDDLLLLGPVAGYSEQSHDRAGVPGGENVPALW